MTVHGRREAKRKEWEVIRSSFFPIPTISVHALVDPPTSLNSRSHVQVYCRTLCPHPPRLAWPNPGFAPSRPRASREGQ